MNILDRAIGFVSPEAGARRLGARLRMESMAQLSYEGAKMGRATAGWQTTSASGSAVLAAGLASLRDRSRELVRNNHYAANAKKQWSSRVVGTGIQLQAEPRVMELWNRWQEFAAATGRDFNSMQSDAAAARFESGEVLIRRRIRRTSDGLALPIQVQLLESDFLDSSRTGEAGGGYTYQGIEFDLIGRRSAYWLYRRHPGDSFGSGSFESVPVPASEISHVYVEERPGMVRGVPVLAPVMLRIRDLDDYEYAHLLGKKVQACMAVFVQRPEADGTALNTSSLEEGGIRKERVEPGTINYTGPGETVTFTNPHTDGSYGEYKTHIVRDIAAGLGIPYEIISGNLSTVNYSSYRAGLIAFKSIVEREQWSVMIPMVCEPVFRWFVEAAQILGELPTGPVPHTWAPPEFNLLDRYSEAQADELELKIGTSTWPQVVGRRGYDREEQIAEIEQWGPRVRKALEPKETKAV